MYPSASRTASPRSSNREWVGPVPGGRPGRQRRRRARDLEHVLPVRQAADVHGGHQGFQVGLPGSSASSSSSRRAARSSSGGASFLA